MLSLRTCLPLMYVHEQIFADWLVATYGVERLKAGGGVCDVAGGHGDVSVRLWINHSIPCTIIDPRKVGFKKR